MTQLLLNNIMGTLSMFMFISLGLLALEEFNETLQRVSLVTRGVLALTTTGIFVGFLIQVWIFN